MRVIKYKVS